MRGASGRPWSRPTTEADGFPLGLLFPVVLALMVPFKLLVLPLMAGPRAASAHFVCPQCTGVPVHTRRILLPGQTWHS